MRKFVLPALAAASVLITGVSGCSNRGSETTQAAAPAESASTEVKIEEVFKGSKTLNGTALSYPEGNPELRLYRVEIPVGGKIPVHTHPAPMLVHVQGFESGDLLNTRVQPDGTEVSTVFKPGESFIEGSAEPHFVQNNSDKPTVVWVMVASVEGMPTTEWDE
ncbi:cupin domain-containing protein [Synechococcus sp. MIT S9508]|uniref:cupin domain-containing protein n=1 Tax=Synechococcus sp. MIT S9508 TaxID=1801629 RepID=UPI0007BC8049|nr:cupin domain-containing protein [Synechococcus sp. MIT S9508]KZR91213.1 hypothetical protein MITS9508_00451 [Synechococcus sp. MIT S9508]